MSACWLRIFEIQDPFDHPLGRRFDLDSFCYREQPQKLIRVLRFRPAKSSSIGPMMREDEWIERQDRVTG